VFFQFVNVFERGDEAVAQVGRDVRAALANELEPKSEKGRV
jgi:hypothetical protein